MARELFTGPWIAMGPGGAKYASFTPSCKIHVNEYPDALDGLDVTAVVCGTKDVSGPRRLARQWLQSGAKSVLLYWLGGDMEIYVNG